MLMTVIVVLPRALRSARPARLETSLGTLKNGNFGGDPRERNVWHGNSSQGVC
jgi:hypothetical protein